MRLIRRIGIARFLALACAVLWSLALIVGAYMFGLYATVDETLGGTTRGTDTLVGANGNSFVVVLLIPLLISLAVAALLWLRKPPATIAAWTLTAGLLGLALLAMLSVGIFLLPVPIALGIACALRQPEFGWFAHEPQAEPVPWLNQSGRLDRNMLRRASAAFAVLAIGLGMVALWAFFDNPTIDGTSRGVYGCSAPWDTVLNDAPNYPGGDPPPDADSIAERCIDVGRERFDTSVKAGIAAGAATCTAAALLVAGILRSRKPPA